MPTKNISKKTNITPKLNVFAIFVLKIIRQLIFTKNICIKKEEPNASSFYFDYANNAIRFFADSDCSCAS